MGLNTAQKKERSKYLDENLNITECSQKNPYVFISYASDNWETVFKEAVVPLQKQYGLRTYADKAFDKVNDKWIVPMLRNVRGADMMLAFVSQSYIESYACFLELLTAVNNRKQIVFVSLGEDLHLGDTTDQPNVERGVKKEILNQGGNIATNTNNTSNDIMRAMKSAYTSLATLLEQDALSKYDISDAFINFFRDASINIKTIHDILAVKDTIHSISSNVFDPSLIGRTIPAAAAPEVQPEPAPPSGSAPTADPPEPVIDGPEPPGPEAERRQSAVPASKGKDRKQCGSLKQSTEKLKSNPARSALMTGILSFLLLYTPLAILSLPVSIFGVVCGIRGLKAGKKPLSIAGLVLNGILLLMFLAVLL